MSAKKNIKLEEYETLGYPLVEYMLKHGHEEETFDCLLNNLDIVQTFYETGTFQPHKFEDWYDQEVLNGLLLKRANEPEYDNLMRMPEKTYEYVNHPSHYNAWSMETIDMMVKLYGREQTAQWCEMTAFKYAMRMGFKPDNSVQQDLDKRNWYLNKAKELRDDNN